MSKAPLKILCFHGYRQTGDSFKQKTGSLRKIFKKHADLYYLTAPWRIPPPEDSEEEDGGRAWWFSRKDDFFQAKYKSDFVKGFEESLKCVEDYVTSHGPFDGFLGFSQGASMVSLLCHLQETGSLSYSFRFAVLIAGFVSQSSPHAHIYARPATLKTLHVYGQTDQVIGEQMSVDLLEHFLDPVTLQHPGGHFVPASAPQKPVYIKFLEEMQDGRPE